MKPSLSRILIVDDHAENRYYLEALLTGHGYRVQSAAHGAEALVLARQQPPDVIVSDLLMPVMDGYTLLRHWKLDPRLRQSPFVVYTATYTEPEDERLAFSLGADAFILKPAEPEAFVAELNRVFTRHTSAPAAPTGLTACLGSATTGAGTVPYLRLNWTASTSSDARYYRIYYGDGAAPLLTQSYLIATPPAGTAQWVLWQLDANNPVQLSMTTVDRQDNESAAATLTLATLPAACGN